MPYILKDLYNNIENEATVHEILDEYYSSDVFLIDPAISNGETEQKLRTIGENQIADRFIAGEL